MVDFRKQLRINQHKTIIVIALFIFIYAFIGFLLDLYFNSTLNQMGLGNAFLALIHFQIIPKATIIMALVAVIAVFITFALHDRIILFGTTYREINSKTARKLEEKQLYNVVSEMRIAAGLRYMPKVYLIEAEYMNAFASGYSEKSALIAITSGLLYKLERDELQAVIAHEMSHIHHNDIKLTLVASVLSNIMLMAIDILFYNALFSGRRRRDEEGANKLLFIIILLRYLLPIITLILLLYLSRTREFMADAGAVELTRNNSPLGRALLKISGDHAQNRDSYTRSYRQTAHEEVRQASYIFDPTQANISFTQSFATLFSTHPPLKERLKAIGFGG
jgi:heat shock protein HtpX